MTVGQQLNHRMKNMVGGGGGGVTSSDVVMEDNPAYSHLEACGSCRTQHWCVPLRLSDPELIMTAKSPSSKSNSSTLYLHAARGMSE